MTPPTLDPAQAQAIGESFDLSCRLIRPQPSRLLRPVLGPSPAGVDDGLFEWQRDALIDGACRREGGRFLAPLAGISVPRGNGKSWAAALVALWRFRFGPQPQTVLSVGLLVDGARVISSQKRAGVARSWATKMPGHQTESVYRLYAIVSDTTCARRRIGQRQTRFGARFAPRPKSRCGRC